MSDPVSLNANAGRKAGVGICTSSLRLLHSPKS